MSPMTKLPKWIGGIVGLYVVFVVLFESVYLGHLQPSFEERRLGQLSQWREQSLWLPVSD